MGTKYKEYGGGAATGLSDDFVKFLSQGLNTGTFGAGSPAGGEAMGQTEGIAGILNDILSGGAGKLGGSMAQLISNDTNDQVNSLRARFGVGGGTAYGTGAQYGEGVLRAKQAPALAQAVGGLQMNAITNLLGIISGISQKGIAQRSGTMSPSPWASAFATAAPLIGAGLGFMAGGPAGAAVGSSAGKGIGGSIAPDSPAPGGSVASINYGWTPTLFDYGLKAA
jgi:hypothetical protein